MAWHKPVHFHTACPALLNLAVLLANGRRPPQGDSIWGSLDPEPTSHLQGGGPFFQGPCHFLAGHNCLPLFFFFPSGLADSH